MDSESPEDKGRKKKQLGYMLLNILTSPQEHLHKTRLVTCKIKTKTKHKTNKTTLWKRLEAYLIKGQNIVAWSRKIFIDQDVQNWNVIFAKYKLS